MRHFTLWFEQAGKVIRGQVGEGMQMQADKKGDDGRLVIVDVGQPR